MISKETIYKKLQKESEKYWKVSLFEDLGYKRKKCIICFKGFWSLKDDKICPEHKNYEFIGNPICKKSLDIFETWEVFRKFFLKNKHKEIYRYPVVSTWNPKLYFTVASIQNFIRLNGRLSFEYPENPLIVPQICLRFNDLQNVGYTNRHMTCFQMNGQHSFLDGSEDCYWKDECIKLNFDFLNKELGIPKEEIVYVEDLWAMPDFSAFGPTIEAHSLGLELVNNVFMQFSLFNGKIEELDLKVVDVGWGHERLSWFSQGSNSIYEATYPYVIKKILEESKIDIEWEILKKFFKHAWKLNIEEKEDFEQSLKEISKIEKIDLKKLKENLEKVAGIFSIADHSKCLAFGICDGILPSNVGGGYNLRIVLRRSLNFIKKFNLNLDLFDVIKWQVEYNKKMFKELEENLDEMERIIEVEKEKYLKNKERVKKLIEIYKRKKISREELIKLYESEGILPEELGIKVDKEFYSDLTQKHSEKKQEEKILFDVSKIAPTKILYYEEPFILSFKAKILKIFDNWVVLDRTAFYPTSGGQLHDEGYIKNSKVIDVIKINNVIAHKVINSENLKEGEIVNCNIDENRRKILTIHHDAIHIINGAARKVLGRHCKQYGSEKNIDKARIDLTHYKNLEENEVEKIERIANKVALDNLKIEKIEMERMEAEKRFGFEIYQGGYVPSKKVRIVKIGDFDIEACGGTHFSSCINKFPIKIIKTKKISDGLIRIEIKAGEKAIEYLKEKESILEELKNILNVDEENVVKKIEEMFKYWKKLRKMVKKNEKGRV